MAPSSEVGAAGDGSATEKAAVAELRAAASEAGVAAGAAAAVAAAVPAPPRLTPVWALKVVYCLGTGSSACLWKYITVFYHHVGLTNSQIGLVQMLNPSVNFVAQLAWAAICDRLGSYKEVLVCSTSVGVVTICSLLLPAVQQHFAAICAVALVASAFFASRGSINDSMVLQVVQDYKDAQLAAERRGEDAACGSRRPRLPSYGQQRLWGAAGWGGGSLLGGLLMDSFGISFMFLSFSVLLAICIGVIATQYPARRAARARVYSGRGAPTFMRFEVLWFLSNLFIYGMGMALVETFLFVFLLRDFQGTSSFLLGSTVAVMCVFEVPVFFYADWLIARVPLSRLLSACHFIFAGRCLAYSILPAESPALVLVVEPLHGLTFAMMWSAAVEYGKRLSPPGAEARMQALLNGLYYQLAIGLGSFIWGHVTKEPPHGMGFRAAYRLAAACMVAWSAIWNLGWMLHGCRSRPGTAAGPLLPAPSEVGGDLRSAAAGGNSS